MRLEGKAALITGVDSSLGRQIAIHFAHEGARVAGVGDSSGGAGAIEEIQRQGGTGVYVEADISKPAGAEKAVADALDAFGRIDAVINYNTGADLFDRLKDADLVVRRHDRDEDGPVRQRLSQGVEIKQAVGLHRERGHPGLPVPLEGPAGIKHRVVFRHDRDDVVAFLAHGEYGGCDSIHTS